MSQEIDQRVVEMRFDNAQFEEKSRKTMRTLDKLREKLRFDGAEKGIEKVQQAAEDVDFSGMETGLDRVQEKFSALDVIAFTTLQNITNRVISTGEQMVKSLSLDQVTSGWDKYVEKTGNVQTIMNATGKSIDQVNGYLNKLMWYSDETSYSFDEMTSALSQMTASGGNIEKMIPMIMGIANATADAGKTGFAFQSTIRNLTQSYSAGHLQLQDWKSLNLMGTATKALKQELIDTAEELGVIKKGDVTIASFESSLSKKWANTTVMEKTFEKYASMMEAVYDLTQKEGITSSEALDSLKGQYGELAERAALAAQQATSFSQAIDSTKDAVSSKWMSVFETIFGNKEQATRTWTELANRLYDVFVPGVEAMNDRLREGLDSGWEQLRRRFGDQADLYAAALEKVALSSGAVSEQAIEEAGSFAEALKQGKVDANLLGTSLDETIASYERMLATVSEDDPRYSHIQKDYEAFLQLNEAVEDGSLDLEHYADKITEVSGREHLMQSLWNIWDAIGKVMGSVHEAFTEIFPPTSGEQIHSIAEGLDVMTGKLVMSDEAAENLKKTFKGVFSVIKVPLTAITTVVKTGAKAFGVLRPVGGIFLEVGAGMGDFLEEMQETLLGTGKLSDKLEGITNSAKKLLHPLTTLGEVLRTSIGQKLGAMRDEISKWSESLPEGAQAAVNGLLSVLEGMLAGGLTLSGAVWDAFSGLKKKVMGALGAVADFVTGQQDTLMGYTDVLAQLPAIVGSAVTAFADEFKGAAGNVEKAADSVFAPVKAFFTALKDGFESISGTDVYRFMSLLDVGLMAAAFISFGKSIKIATANLKSMLANPLGKMADSVSGSFNALTATIKQYSKQQKVDNTCKTLLSLAGAIGILAGSMYLMSKIDPDRFYDVASITFSGIVLLAAAAKILQPTVVSMEKSIEMLKMKAANAVNLWGTATALLAFGIAIKKISDGITAVMSVMTEGDVAKNTAAFAGVVMGMVAMMTALGRLMGKLTVEADGKTLMLGHKAILSTAASLVAMGVALKLVASAVKPLSEIQSTSLAKAGIAVTGLMAALTGMAWVLMACEKTLGGIKMGTGASMVAMAGAVLLVAQAVSMVANADGDVVAATASIMSLMALMGVMGRLAADVTFGSGAGLVMMASAVSMMGGAAMLLSDIPWQKALYGAAELVALGGILVTAGWALKKFVDGFDPKMAASMMGIAASVGILAAAVAAFAFMAGQEDGILGLVAGFVSVAASLAMLGTALAVVDKVCKRQVSTSEAFMKMGVALLAIAGACAVFTNLVEPTSLLMAAGALAGVFAILMGAGFILEKVPLVGVALLTLTKAFKDFGEGLKDIGIGLLVLGLFSKFLKPFCEAIVDAAPDIQNALIAVVTAICNTIVACAEPLVNALVALAMILLDTVVKLIYQLWLRIQPALQDLWNKFTVWWTDVTKDFNIVDFLIPDWSKLASALSPMGGALLKLVGGALDPFLNEMKNGDSFAAGVYQMFAGLGKDASDGFENGFQNGQKKVDDAAGNMADSAADATAKAQDSNSPSKVFEQLGQYCVEGYAIGLENNSLLERVKTAMHNVATAIREVFTTYWGIHSPSQLAENDGLNIAEGLALGMKDKTKAQEIRDVSYAMANNVRTGAEQALSEAQLAIAEKLKGIWRLFQDESIDVDTSGIDMLSGADKPVVGVHPTITPKKKPETPKITVSELVEKVISKEMTYQEALKQVPDALVGLFQSKLAGLAGITNLDMLSQEELTEALMAQYDKYLPDDPTATDPTGTGKTKSSGKGKTLAETIAEKYSKELKANKYLQDAASKEYTLWENTEGDTASIEALIEKKGESLANSIELQTARVDIAQRQYDELLSRVGENDDKTKDARATLLDEKNTLAELRKQRYETLYKAAIERYESDDEVAQSEYQLWADTYEKTASVTEKSNKEIEQINKRLATQSAKTALAEKAWADTCDALGEASVEAQARYLELLKQQQAEQELKNELADAQLDLYDKLDAEIQNRMSAAKKRQSLLDKLYNDGDLASRESAYESAVEQYGADSLEARRAATQGTMSALMGVASAMNNLQFQMKTLTNAQNKYDAVIEQGYAMDSEQALEAYGEVMDARSGFADYMGNLADAFDVSDGTKRAMMQVGDALAKNWRSIQNGMNKVLANVNPQVADSLKNVVGLYMREGASETMSATANAIVAAMSGDWAQAVASGLAAVLNVVGTDFGQTLTEAIGSALKLAFNGNGLFMQLLMKFFGGAGDGLTNVSSGTGSVLKSIGNSLSNLLGGGSGNSSGKSFLSDVANLGKGLLGLGKAAKTTTSLIPVLSTATAEAGTAAVATTEAVAGAGGLTAALGKAGTMIASVASKLGPHGLIVGAVAAGGALIVKNWDKVKGALSGLWNGLTTVVGGAVNIGKNLVGGLWNGIKTVAGGLWNGVKSVCGGILNGIKSFFGIHSPSKVMAEIGVYIGEGLTNGIVSTGDSAAKGMDDVGNAVLESAHTVGQHIADFMASDDSARPTIRPVVDLSDAAKSSAWLNTAFADRKGTISMAATVSGQMARQMGTAAKVQNGAERQTVKPQSNRDVVEAVAALGDRIDGIAKAVSNMKVELNGKKLVGGIKADMNAALGGMVK